MVKPVEGCAESGFADLLLHQAASNEIGEGDAAAVVVVHGLEYLFRLKNKKRAQGSVESKTPATDRNAFVVGCSPLFPWDHRLSYHTRWLNK